MEVYIVVIAAVLIVSVLLWTGVLSFSGRNTRLSGELRQLLLDRADGKIDEAEFERRQVALHASLLEQKPAVGNKKLWWGLPLAVILVATGLYFSTGKQDAPEVKLPGPMGTRFGSSAPKPATSQGMSPSKNGGDLNTMAKRLNEKLAKDPGNGEGWLLLARTYTELHQPKEAANAYAKAAPLVALDASMLADWADAHVVSHDRKWDAEAKKILQRALEADPKHLKSLALGGSEAFDRADYKAAIAYWKRMKAVAPADSMDAKLADANIHEAEAMISGKKPTVLNDKSTKPIKP